MSKLTRVTAKVFGATADGTLADPEIGQFGSAKAGTYNGTGDIATIQGLAAWSNGWIDAVTPTQQFPSLPERTGVDKVLSYQNAYVLQQGIPEWDSGTDYYTNGFCSKNGKIYFSKTDNNLNNDPEADTVNWEEFISGGAIRNIGEIVQSTMPLTDAGLHLLDGTQLSGSGIYSAFVDYIADLYDSGDYTDIFDTEANWQTAVTNYGVCGKFVYNSTNRTVRLPKYSNKIYTGGGTAPVKGNGKTLGLTDGTKEGGLHTSGISGYPYFTAGTTAINTYVGTSNTALDLNNNVTVGVTTDGTKSGIIADLANITTSLDGYYYIVIATSTKTDIEVDIDEIATDLNGKADVDLTNCTKPHIVETYVNGTSWYRVYSDGWCEQGGYNTYSNKTVNFVNNYVNTSYFIFTQPDYNSSTVNANVINAQSKTVSGFTCYLQNYSSGGFYWEAKGYIS